MSFSKNFFLILCFFLLTYYPLMSQKIVSGIVFSSTDSEPLVGVTVLVKGTQNGTITDLEGSFSLNLSNDQNTIIASFVGYKSKEVNIGNM